MFFAKIPRGVKAFRKNCLGVGGGGPPNADFIAFLLTSVLKFALPPPPPSPVCIYARLNTSILMALYLFWFFNIFC